MAVLTSSGVTFSDSTTISSKYDVIPQSNTPLYFYQSSAPTGWSQVSSNNNKMMRVVSGTGAGTGGSNAFTNTFTNRTYSANFNVPFSAGVNNHTLSTPQLPSHSHSTEAGDGRTFNPIPQNSSNNGFNSQSSHNSGNAGNGGGHNHSASVSASASWSAGIDMRVQYINVIYCTFS